MTRRPRGELESTVLRVLWEAEEPISARDVQAGVAATGEEPALTTVLTVLERMRAKGQVRRAEAQHGGLVFAPTRSESGHTADAMLQALMGSSDRSAALLSFAGHLQEQDLDALRRAIDGTPLRRTKSR